MMSTIDAFRAEDPYGLLPEGAGHQFARYTAFDWGQIAWNPQGLPSVGCAAKEIYDNFYQHAYGDRATYYSIPGRCCNHTGARTLDSRAQAFTPLRPRPTRLCWQTRGRSTAATKCHSR